MYHCTHAVRFGCHLHCSIHRAKSLNRKLRVGELHFEVRSVFSAGLKIQTVRSREQKSGEMKACSIAVHTFSVCSVINFICLFVVCLFSWRYNPLWLYFHSPVAGFSLLVFEFS